MAGGFLSDETLSGMFASRVRQAEAHGEFFQSPDRELFAFEGPENRWGQATEIHPEDIRVEAIEAIDPGEVFAHQDDYLVTITGSAGAGERTFELTADQVEALLLQGFEAEVDR
jgi:hypothetical protein